jgi:hypothetical protein
MRTAAYQSGVDTCELFRLETTGTGVLAIRDAAPRFVLWGNTAHEAFGSAMRALEFASGMSAGTAETQSGSGRKPASPTAEGGDAQ